VVISKINCLMGSEISRHLLARGQHLCLEKILWRDERGREGIWECAARNAARPATLMIAWLHPSDRLLLVRQNRPPARGDVIEFPAGLMDDAESPDQAALRELLEETGYTGRIERMLPAAYNTPGLSSEKTHLALVVVDETAPPNLSPVSHHESGEEITVLKIARCELQEFLASEIQIGTQFDSKVLAYLAALCWCPK
jgi:8-oxo-dGTP pyrophosphatase MutT (NUDIX family)